MSEFIPLIIFLSLAAHFMVAVCYVASDRHQNLTKALLDSRAGLVSLREVIGTDHWLGRLLIITLIPALIVILEVSYFILFQIAIYLDLIVWRCFVRHLVWVITNKKQGGLFETEGGFYGR